MQGKNELGMWRSVRDFAWVADGWSLVKIPITPSRIPAMENELQSSEAIRRYCVGGNVAWVAWPADDDKLDNLLRRLSLVGMRVLGPYGRVFLGIHSNTVFARRVKQALDPHNRFPQLD